MAEFSCPKCDKTFDTQRALDLHNNLAHTRAGKQRLARQVATRIKNKKSRDAHPELLQIAGKTRSRVLVGNETLKSIPQHRTGSGLDLLTKATAVMLFAESVDRMTGPALGRLMAYINTGQFEDEKSTVLGETGFRLPAPQANV